MTVMCYYVTTNTVSAARGDCGMLECGSKITDLAFTIKILCRTNVTGATKNNIQYWEEIAI